MDVHPRKKRITNFTSAEGSKCDELYEKNREVEEAADVKEAPFRLLELPPLLVYDIFSRLQIKNIFLSRLVSKMFLKLLKNPYFAQTHLDKCPTSTAALIFLSGSRDKRFVFFYMFDLNETSITSSYSSAPYQGPHFSPHSLTKFNAEFCFTSDKSALVSSCNGLLCLYIASESPNYFVCNPIISEYVILPVVTPSTPDYTYYDSAFGFSPKTKQYKVLRFMSFKSSDPDTVFTTTKRVVEIHTIGSDSWTTIEAPSLELRRSFDPCLNGVIHWVTNGEKHADLICSFDLDTERFKYVPPPSHFNHSYIRKISWISIGILSGCLCLCHVYDNTYFEIWQMKEYDVKESWTNVCKIEIKFYCGLKVEDLRRPLKFMSNGDLWLVCSSNTLLAYSPKKGTFREYKKLQNRSAEVIAHVPSFVSLKHIAKGTNLTVKVLPLFKLQEIMDQL